MGEGALLHREAILAEEADDALAGDAIEEGAVRALEISEVPSVVAGNDLGVNSREKGLVDHDRAIGTPANRRL